MTPQELRKLKSMYFTLTKVIPHTKGAIKHALMHMRDTLDEMIPSSGKL